MATQPSSEILDLTEASRRSVLKSLAVSGGVVSGINQIAKKVSGETPDGVPLVHTYDSQGNPAQVRYVSKEKKRRLKFIENFPIEKYLVTETMSMVSLRRLVLKAKSQFKYT